VMTPFDSIQTVPIVLISTLSGRICRVFCLLFARSIARKGAPFQELSTV
jgi:hypothetical protein